jgi:hypothetical protein
MLHAHSNFGSLLLKSASRSFWNYEKQHLCTLASVHVSIERTMQLKRTHAPQLLHSAYTSLLVMFRFVLYIDRRWLIEKPGFDSQGRQKIIQYSKASKPLFGPTQIPVQWVLGALSLRVKWMEHEADHSPSSSVEIKNGGSIPPFPHTSSWHRA